METFSTGYSEKVHTFNCAATMTVLSYKSRNCARKRFMVPLGCQTKQKSRFGKFDQSSGHVCLRFGHKLLFSFSAYMFCMIIGKLKIQKSTSTLSWPLSKCCICWPRSSRTEASASIFSYPNRCGTELLSRK